VILNDGRRVLDDNNDGLDECAFVVVVFEVVTEVIEAVIGDLFKERSYHY
jgi:hypothetical protein